MDVDENCQVFPTQQLANGLSNCGNTLHDPLEVVSMLVHRAPISYYRLFLKEVSDLPNLSPYRMQNILYSKFVNCSSLFKCESKTFQTVQLKQRLHHASFPLPKIRG